MPIRTAFIDEKEEPATGRNTPKKQPHKAENRNNPHPNEEGHIDTAGIYLGGDILRN